MDIYNSVAFQIKKRHFFIKIVQNIDDWNKEDNAYFAVAGIGFIPHAPVS